MKLADLLNKKEVYCSKTDETVQEVVNLMAQKKIGAVPILDDDHLVGIFTERDLVQKVVAKRRDPSGIKIEQVMTKELIVSPPECEVIECIGLMKKYGVRHIPVVSDKKLIGIISLRDLMQVDIEYKKYEIQVLHEYIHYIPPFVAKNL